MAQTPRELAFFGVAVLGIVLVMVGVLVDRAIPPTVVFLGFVLLIGGYAALAAEGRKKRLQRISPLPASPGPIESGVPPQRGGVDDLRHGVSPKDTPSSFDLSSENEERRKRIRFRLLSRYALAGLFGFVELELILGGTLRRNSTELLGAVALAPLLAILAYVLWLAGRGVTRIDLNSEGIQIRFDNQKTSYLRWDASNWSITVWASSAAVNLAGDPPKDGPSFLLTAKFGNRLGFYSYVSTYVPGECLGALLRESDRRSLKVEVGTAGVAGTVSERSTYRFGGGLIRR